jgi:hypothetical protein
MIGDEAILLAPPANMANYSQSQRREDEVLETASAAGPEARREQIRRHPDTLSWASTSTVPVQGAKLSFSC